MALTGLSYMPRFSQTKWWYSTYQILAYTFIVLLTTGGIFIFTDVYAGESPGPILVLMFTICGGLTVYAWLVQRYVKNPESAVKYYTDQINKVPYNLASYNMRALAYQKLRNFDAAIADYEKMNALIGDKTDKTSTMYRDVVTNNLGSVYFSQGEYEKALIQLTKALTQPGVTNLNRCVMHIGRGNTYLELYNVAAALEEFDRVADIIPELNPPNQREMALRVLYGNTFANYRLERKDRALDYWKRATQLEKKLMDPQWIENESEWLPWHMDAAKDLTARLQNETSTTG